MMRHAIFLLSIFLSVATASAATWRSHLANSNFQQVAVTGSEVYVLSDGSLFSINKQTEEKHFFTRQDGLSGANIVYMHYDEVRDKLLLFYANGYLDMVGEDGLLTISALYLTQTTMGKQVQSAVQKGDMLYLAMPYGIQTFNLASHTFVDTYIIGDEATEMNVTDVTLVGDTLYAATEGYVYRACLTNNPMDYRTWQTLPVVAGRQLQQVATLNNQLVALWGDRLYVWQSGAWVSASSLSISRLVASNGHLLALGKQGGFYDLTDNSSILMPSQQPSVAAYDPLLQDYWSADNQAGLTHLATTGLVAYPINSPLMNMPTRMYYGGDKLFVVPGDRWAVENRRPGCVMMYHHSEWQNISHECLARQAGRPAVTDLMSVAVDSADQNHYWLAAYGQGVYEMLDTTMLGHWDATNSSLINHAGEAEPESYTRVDHIQFDRQGNLWFTDLHIMVKLVGAGWNQLLTFPLHAVDGTEVSLETPAQMLHDEDAHRIWVGTARKPVGLGVYEYQGTLTDTSDDRNLHRVSFHLDDGSLLQLNALYWIVQDLDGHVWLCANDGLFYFSADDDFFTSDRLHHLGVMEGDSDWFLRGVEVQSMAVDAQNRKWIGTKTKGVYLLSADNQQVLAHYTKSNSPLPSDNILSIAINPVTGVVMIGSSDGLVEYDDSVISALTEQEMEEFATEDYSGLMNGWTTHFSYWRTQEIASLGDRIYGLAYDSDYSNKEIGSLFYLDRHTEEVRPVTTLSGLSSARIGHIVGDGQGHLLVAYKDGNMDILSADGKLRNLTDLQRKQLAGVSKLLNDAYCHKGKMYLAMEIGILVLDMNKGEFSDWYQPTASSATSIEKVLIQGDSIYAASATTLYVGCMRDNISDYSFWKAYTLNSRSDIKMTTSIQTKLHIEGSTYEAGGWAGIVRSRVSGQDTIRSYFSPNGPMRNKPYRMTTYKNQLYMVAGGRFAVQEIEPICLMKYEDQWWKNIAKAQFDAWMPNPHYHTDFTRVAVDPIRPNHYMISSYGYGVFEMLNDTLITIHNETNSTLRSAVDPSNGASHKYVRAEGVAYDPDGYLWTMNSENTTAMHVLSPDGKWTGLPLRANGSSLSLETPGDVLVDAFRPNYRWFTCARSAPGVGLLNMNGTPALSTDDKCAFHSSYVDMKGRNFSPEAIYSMAQDMDGNILVGTNAGFFIIMHNEDWLTSNRVHRVLEMRDDGSALADYVLGTERINGIAVDGGGRVWFATQKSGVFLIKLDLSDISQAGDHEYVYHFTAENSPLPSNNVLSVAIMQETGEVFFGTDGGLVSFRSDATEPREDYNAAYAYPNPVRPDYQGMLTVTNLVENSSVKITDAAGRAVYSGMSNGGTMVWNLKDVNGHRVAPGVYVIFCNTTNSDDAQHAAIKVLIM